MALDPAIVAETAPQIAETASPVAETARAAVPLPQVEPAPLLPATQGREGVTALLKPRHRQWLEARAAAHGETVEVHAAGLLAGLWQTDPWRLGQSGGQTVLGTRHPR